MTRLKDVYSNLSPQTRKKLTAVLPRQFLRWYRHARTDVYLISYPKCGRTWLRLLIGRSLSNHFDLPEDERILFVKDSHRIHPGVPRIAVFHDDRPMLKAPQELETEKSWYKDKQVVFMVRDPRDVIVSSYFEMKKRGRIFGDNPYESRQAIFEGDLADFITREEGGFATIIRYFNIWAENRSFPRSFLLVRYEDLQTDTSTELRRVLDFLGLNQVSQEDIQEAIHFASFDHMRKMEAEGKFSTGILNPADQADSQSYKTRSGKIGGYREYLTPEQISTLNEIMGSQLSPFFGYSP